MRIKIVNYNILNGSCNDERPFILDKKRLNLIIKVLENENPDIVILTEAYFWPFAKREKLDNYSILFDRIYNLPVPALNQFRWAPVVFSRFPIEFIDLSEFHKAFLRTNIKLGEKKVFLDVIHPHPDLREKEKEELINKVINDHQNPYILAGDLNSLSSEDNYDHNKLLEGYRKFMKNNAEEKVRDLLSFNSIKAILNKKLIDSFKAKNKEFDYTLPTDLRSESKESGVRVDYIFCSKEIKIVNSGIIKNKLTERASDHYPVYTILDI